MYWTSTLLCTATDSGDITMIRHGPWPQEVYTLVNMSHFTFSFLSHLHGKFGVYPSFLLHTLQDVVFLPISVSSLSFPFRGGFYLTYSKYISMPEIENAHWMISPGLHVPTETSFDSVYLYSLEEENLVKAEARRKAWFGLLNFWNVNIKNKFIFNVG